MARAFAQIRAKPRAIGNVSIADRAKLADEIALIERAKYRCFSIGRFDLENVMSGCDFVKRRRVTRRVTRREFFAVQH